MADPVDARQPRRSGGLRTYLLPVALSVVLLVLTPLGLLVVLLSGDSCCGEDTTGTMAAVTAVIVALICVVARVAAVALQDRQRRPGYRTGVAWAVIAAPASLVHVAFVVLLSLTAF